MDLEIVDIQPVYVWFWDTDCEYCPICRGIMTEKCVNCQEKCHSTCAITWGRCKHAFHKCCMETWLDKYNRCPLCQQDWIETKMHRIVDKQ